MDHDGLVHRLRRTWMLTELLEVAAAETLSLLAADRVCLYLWDGKGERLYPAHVVANRVDVLAQTAALEVNPQFIPGVRDTLFEERLPALVLHASAHPWLGSEKVRPFGIQTFWAAPLWDGFQPWTLGALAAHQTAAFRVLGEADREGIQALARAIAVVLENRLPAPRPSKAPDSGRRVA